LRRLSFWTLSLLCLSRIYFIDWKLFSGLLKSLDVVLGEVHHRIDNFEEHFVVQVDDGRLLKVHNKGALYVLQDVLVWSIWGLRLIKRLNFRFSVRGCLFQLIHKRLYLQIGFFKLGFKQCYVLSFISPVWSSCITNNAQALVAIVCNLNLDVTGTNLVQILSLLINRRLVK